MYRIHYILFFLCIFFPNTNCARTFLFKPVLLKEHLSNSGLRHPGILLNASEINQLGCVLNQHNAKKEAEWIQMLKFSAPDNWTPADTLKGDQIATTFKISRAILRYVIEYVLTGSEVAELKAINLLNSWQNLKAIMPLSSIDIHHKLHLGVHSGYLANAAELLRYTSNKWSENDIAAFSNVVRTKILPFMINDRPNKYNGNWDLSLSWSSLAYAVFLDDGDLFKSQLNYLLTANSNGTWEKYMLPSGQNQESARDQLHAQMGIQFASFCAQICWNQGIDIYDYNNISLSKCVEYLAAYNLGNDNLPFVVYPSPVGRNQHDYNTSISADLRGSFYSMYEMIYYHYKTYKNITLPYTKSVLEKIYPEYPNATTNMFNSFFYNDIGCYVTDIDAFVSPDELVFDNSISGKLIIHSDVSLTNLRIYDVMGRVILNRVINDKLYYVALSNGLYYVEVNNRSTLKPVIIR